MHNLLKTGLCLFLLIFSTITVAETAAESVPEQKPVDAVSVDETEARQYYIVEVVLFRHLNEHGKKEEYWYHPAINDDPENFMTVPFIQDNRSQQISDDIPALAEYDMTNKRFLPLRNGIAALSASNYKLADSAAHLRYSPNFQLLAHFGWTQRSLSKKAALPILIKSESFSDRLLPSGELKLYVSRYLHMQVDLAATQCLQTAEPDASSSTKALDDKALDEKLEQGTSTIDKPELRNISTGMIEAGQCVNNTYRFQQGRKMRSKELHYLDNPVYGLLVYVTPFTVKE